MPGPIRSTLPPLLIATLIPTAALARQSAPERPSRPGASERERRHAPETQLERLWFARKAALESGDAAAAADRIEEMTRLLRSERLDRVTWLARGFAYEGYEHLTEGNYERARAAFDIARRFDPRMPEAQTGYAWAALRAGRGVGTFVREYRRALWLRWEAYKREGTANAFLVSLVALWLAATIVIGTFFLRYQAMLRHDVGEWIPSGWPEGATRLAGWVFLLAPLFVWVGGAWLLLYWSVVLARYMSGTEKIVAAAACVAVAFSGPLAERGASAAESSADPTVVAVEAALQGGYGADVMAELQRSLKAVPDPLALRLLLATTYERAGLFREAFEEYQTILKAHPDDPRALNNVGNLFMRNGQTAQAIVYYTRAAEADPRQALHFYNLYLAQSEALRLADAEGSVRMMQQLDPDLARTLVEARGRGEESPPLTSLAPAEQVWSEAGGRGGGGGPGPSWRHLGSPTAMGALAATALIGWLAIGRSSLRAQACVRCGEAFCGRCKKELGARECCTQCIHLFVKKGPIAPEIRAQKLRQVERFVRTFHRRVRLATIVMPGSGHLLAGRAISGALLLAGWVFPLTAVLLGSRLVLPPSLPVLNLPALTTLAMTGFLAALWSAANLFPPRPPA